MWRVAGQLLLIMLGGGYIALGIIYWQSSTVLDRQFPADTRNLQLSLLPELLAEGERLAMAYGCTSCHGAQLQGRVLEQGLLVGKIVAPNLTRAMDSYSLNELEAIVRQGVRPDGTSVYMMPSSRFSVMSDREFSAIASYIRQSPRQAEDPGRTRYGLLWRYRIQSDQWPAEALAVDSPWPPGFEVDALRFGQYLARMACDSCHDPAYPGSDLQAGSLAQVQGYDRVEFNRMLRRGEGQGGKPLATKPALAANRFRVLTDAEIDALYRYLTAVGTDQQR